jgi:hypothetical protein
LMLTEKVMDLLPSLTVIFRELLVMDPVTDCGFGGNMPYE